MIFYPVFYILDLIQIIDEILSEEGTNVFIPFIELAQGVKLVLLFPCLMTVDNEQVYLSSVKIIEPEPMPRLEQPYDYY